MFFLFFNLGITRMVFGNLGWRCKASYVICKVFEFRLVSVSLGITRMVPGSLGFTRMASGKLRKFKLVSVGLGITGMVFGNFCGSFWRSFLGSVLVSIWNQFWVG